MHDINIVKRRRSRKKIMDLKSVQLAVVKQNGIAIEHIENPTESDQLAAVTQNGWVLDLIKNPSKSVQLAAVTKNGWAIQYIKNTSEEIVNLYFC